jgi:glycosyltransferase involved in cell wall biosynthesis
MLIGIDASRAAVARRTGTENYALHLIQELVRQNPEHRFRLYWNEFPPREVYPEPLEHRVIPFPRLWTHVRLSAEMLRQPPDLLFVPSHVLPLIHPKRSVATVHDLGYHHYPEAHTLFQNVYLRWSTRFNARTAARVLADSEATRRDLERYYRISPDKIVVVYPGRDERLSPVSDPVLLAAVRNRYGITGDYLLYVGTLHPRKNLVRLVQAFAAILAQGTKSGVDPGLCLVLAGQEGWLYTEIVAQVHKLGLEQRVLLPGYVPDADLAALLSGALAFVFPSLYEGFGLPVLEAMACGTPVICSNTSSLPEVAGDAALLVDPLDVEMLADGILRSISDGGLRRDLVERGFRQTQRFTWQRCAREAMAVLEEVGRGVD